MFKRILVAVDGSHTSELALQEAIKLAGEVRAQLRIVHVVDNVNLNLSAEFPNPSEIWDAMIKGGQAILHKAGAAANAAGIAVESGLIEIDTLGHRHPGNDRRRRRCLARRPDRHRHPRPPGAEPPAAGQRRRGRGARRHQTGAADPGNLKNVPCQIPRI